MEMYCAFQMGSDLASNQSNASNHIRLPVCAFRSCCNIPACLRKYSVATLQRSDWTLHWSIWKTFRFPFGKQYSDILWKNVVSYTKKFYLSEHFMNIKQEAVIRFLLQIFNCVLESLMLLILPAYVCIFFYKLTCTTEDVL